jgi:hypothetical protein
MSFQSKLTKQPNRFENKLKSYQKPLRSKKFPRWLLKKNFKECTWFQFKFLIWKGVKNIKDNIDDATQLSQVKPYQKPTKLRKRSEIHEAMQAKIFESNT